MKTDMSSATALPYRYFMLCVRSSVCSCNIILGM